MTTLIHWFRNDLRLADNPALSHVARQADRVLPVYVHAPSADTATPWGFPRRGAHRRRFLRAALDALHARLVEEGSGLAADKIRSSEKITNSELRKALAAFSGGNQDQEG